MQDIHSIGGGRFFAGSGGGGGGDRRLRPHHHLHHHHHHHHHQVAQPQALKCPRCDSANTKFCYYNNYNQSQPRHFCKSCRRYWTKGGVLRNVPVGGGCRKNKRSKQKANSSSVVSAAAAQDLKSSNSHSSSESSSLTATTTIANATEAVSAPSDPEPPPPQSKSAANSNPSLFSDPPPAAAPNSLRGSLFSEIGSFTSLMANSSSAAVSGGGVGVGTGTAMHFEFGSISEVYDQLSQSWNNQQNQKDYLSAAIGAVNRDRNDQELKVQEIASAGGLMIDQTAQVDLSALQQDRSNGGGFGSLGDWLQCGDQGLFDLTSTVDQQYWSQNQWNDQDHPGLYLP